MADTEKVMTECRFAELAMKGRAQEPVNTRASYGDITGSTYNSLMDCCTVLRAISNALEGDADTRKNEPEIKCIRDVLVMNQELAAYILSKLNELFNVFGGGV